MDEKVKKELRLDALTEISMKENEACGRFFFLSLGELSLHYSCDTGHMDQAVAKLLGAVDDKQYHRKNLSNAHLSVSIPSEATHYLLGTPVCEEGSYRTIGKTMHYSSDKMPVVFLRAGE